MISLIILDGFGAGQKHADNAILNAKTPFYDQLIKNSPNCLIKTSGQAVGLPAGQMGNSEVGHMSIGAGRIILQDLPKINSAIENKSIEKNKELINFIGKLKKSKGDAHLMGMISDGGVHSSINHIIEIAKIISSNGITTHIHAFLDGRDTAQFESLSHLKKIDEINVKISTVSGRYYAMDRDKNWNRIEKAYNVIANGDHSCSNLFEHVKLSHNQNISDEFIEPKSSNSYEGMKDDDGILMANFRADRARQILNAFLCDDFKEFQREKIIFAAKLGLTEYSEILNEKMKIMFESEKFENSLGQIIEKQGLKQLRIAETEKYAHVTFFFNGGREKKFKGENRILIPSPNVKTYDEKPEMSANQLTDSLIKAIPNYDLIIANYANADMVGHTGNFEATKKSIETIDASLARVVPEIVKDGGIAIITADHGNAEQMTNRENDEIASPHTSHTTNLVPLIIAGAGNILLKNGALQDIAPTILKLMKIEKPTDMTGNSLIS